MQAISTLSTTQRPQIIRINPQASNNSFRPVAFGHADDSFTKSQPANVSFTGIGSILGKIFRPGMRTTVQRLSPAASRSIKSRFKIDRMVRRGYQMVEVNAKKFDHAFKHNEHQYLAAGGKCQNAIKNRYQRFIEYLKGGEYIRPSEITMQTANVNGKRKIVPFFEDGRHRYAVLRDMGMGKIPVAMSKESIKLAKKAGML